MYPRDGCIYKLGSPNYVKSLWLEQDGDVHFFQNKASFFSLYKMVNKECASGVYLHFMIFSPILKGAIKGDLIS